MKTAQWQITLLGASILAPTGFIALLLMRRQALVPGQLRAR
jgi:hypothetical protein